MYVGIFGSGKWALLISQKLNDLGIQHIIFGSNKAIRDVKDRLNVANIKLNHAIIASSTKEHLNDLMLCLKTNPKNIFIEKGLDTPIDNHLKLKLINSNIFILNQYRFSEVMRILKKFDLNKIVSIKYSLMIDSDNVSEWVPHILSIDNFIRNKENTTFIHRFGIYSIDKNVSLKICKKKIRKITAYIDTTSFNFIINFGKDNSLSIYSKRKNRIKNLSFLDEDCLKKQIFHIFNDKTINLQKLNLN